MSENENNEMNEDTEVDNATDTNLPTVEQVVEENTTTTTNGKRKRKSVPTKEKVVKEKSSLPKGFTSFKDENKKEKTILIDNGVTLNLNGNNAKNNKNLVLVEGKYCHTSAIRKRYVIALHFF